MSLYKIKEIKKLVRDNIPDIIIADGRKPKIKVIEGHDLLLALNEALCELDREITPNIKWNKVDGFEV